MYIQIDNTGFVNKGAELMLHAITHKLGNEKSLHPRFVFGKGKGKAEDIRISGLFQKIQLQRFKLPIDKLLQQNVLEKYGLVKTNLIHAILDAGGFQFGDQWESFYNEEVNTELDKYYTDYKNQGTKLIFLPQAFGPFKKKLARAQVEIAFRHADVLYARDPISYEHLIDIFGRNDKIKLSPDFTNLLKPDIPLSLYNKVRNSICIIPNYKMISHGSALSKDKYIPYLKDVIDFFLNKGDNVVLLNHEGDQDLELINQLNELTGNRSVILNDLNALEIKAVIKHVKLLISSRFHGVVSGLTQGKPTFCTSWSHKYEELLSLYDCSNNKINIECDIYDAVVKFDNYLNYIPSTLKLEAVETDVNNMWNDIITILKN